MPGLRTPGLKESLGRRGEEAEETAARGRPSVPDAKCRRVHTALEAEAQGAWDQAGDSHCPDAGLQPPPSSAGTPARESARPPCTPSCESAGTGATGISR